MKVLFENEYARFWSDGHSPILYSKVIAVPQKIDELKRMCSIYSKTIKTSLNNYKRIYSLSDFSEIRMVLPKDMVQFYANFLSNLKSGGVVFKAFIKPKGAPELAILNDMVSNSGSLQAASFDRFEEALSAINQLRQSEKMEERSFFKRVLMW